MSMEMTTDGQVVDKDTQSRWSKFIPFRQERKTVPTDPEEAQRARNPLIIPPHEVIRTARQIADLEYRHTVVGFVAAIEGMAGGKFLETMYGRLDVSPFACVAVLFSCLAAIRAIDLGLLMRSQFFQRLAPGYSAPKKDPVMARRFLCGPVLCVFLSQGCVFAWTRVMDRAHVSGAEPASLILLGQVVTYDMIGVLLFGGVTVVALIVRLCRRPDPWTQLQAALTLIRAALQPKLKRTQLEARQGVWPHSVIRSILPRLDQAGLPQGGFSMRNVPFTHNIPWSAVLLLKECYGQSTLLKQASFIQKENFLGLGLLRCFAGVSLCFKMSFILTYSAYIFLYVAPETDQPLQDKSAVIEAATFISSIRNAALEPVFKVSPLATILGFVGVWLYMTLICIQLAIAWDFDFRIVVRLFSLRTQNAELPNEGPTQNP